jgi:hypothetical protein
MLDRGFSIVVEKQDQAGEMVDLGGVRMLGAKRFAGVERGKTKAPRIGIALQDGAHKGNRPHDQRVGIGRHVELGLHQFLILSAPGRRKSRRHRLPQPPARFGSLVIFWLKFCSLAAFARLFRGSDPPGDEPSS